MMAYEDAMKKAAQDDVDKAREILLSLLKDPLIVAVGASSLPCSAEPPRPPPAGKHSGGGTGSTFLQLRFLSLQNLAYLSGDHKEVRMKGRLCALMSIHDGYRHESRRRRGYICISCAQDGDIDTSPVLETGT